MLHGQTTLAAATCDGNTVVATVHRWVCLSTVCQASNGQAVSDAAGRHFVIMTHALMCMTARAQYNEQVLKTSMLAAGPDSNTSTPIRQHNNS